MNVLLVDDDYFVLKGLQQGIEWKTIGVDTIYTAENIQQAKSILQDNTVDVIVCDIEMPNGSGLDLLKWIRERRYYTINIFLTSYAQFEYAKQAIELGSFDYYLKPIAYEQLTEVLRRACQKSAEQKQQRLYFAFGEQWVKNEQIRRNAFFQTLLSDNLSDAQLWKQVEDTGVDFSSKTGFRILYVDFILKPENKNLEKNLLAYGLQNIVAELFVSSGTAKSIGGIAGGKNQWYLLLETTSPNDDLCLLKANELLNTINQYLTSEIKCVLSNQISLQQVGTTAIELNCIAQNQVSTPNGVFAQWKNRHTQASIEYQKPNAPYWEELLKTEQEKALTEAIERYLDQTAQSNELDSLTLHKFYYDFLQILRCK